MEPSNNSIEPRATPAESNFDTEELFRLMVESVEDYAIFMLDPDGRVLTWNLGAERIKLYRANEIIGKHFSAFYPKESIEQGLPQFELTMANGTGRHEDEGWRLRKNGSRFWANVVITALRDRDGQLVGYGKVTRDLSERRRAEQALNTAYNQVNSVLECTSDSVVKIGENWNLIYGNKSVTAMPGFRLGENYWDCFPDVRGTTLETTLRKAMEERCEAAYEIYYDAHRKWYRGRIFPTSDGISIFFTDITEEKTLQEEVDRARYLKEKRIEALGHMAAGLAHEINNPLSIILGTANDLWQASEKKGRDAMGRSPDSLRDNCAHLRPGYQDSARAQGVWTGCRQGPDANCIHLRDCGSMCRTAGFQIPTAQSRVEAGPQARSSLHRVS